MKYEYINKAQQYSKDIIDKISSELSKTLSNKNISIITTGSFARGEANELSDTQCIAFLIEKMDLSDD